MTQPVDFLSAAQRIGHELCRDAIWEGKRCNWLGWSTEVIDGSFSPAYRALSFNLYDGAAGVALFLARLYQLTDDKHVGRTRDGAIARLVQQSEEAGPDLSLGYWNGLAGIAWTLLELGELLGHRDLTDRGVALLRRQDWSRMGPEQWDLVSGAAGVIPALIDAGHRAQAPDLIDRAALLGRRLLETAVREVVGCSWSDASPKTRNLVGFSHGTAAVAVALLELHEVTGDERFIPTAQQALAYERSTFDAARSNWPDYRTLPGAAADPSPNFPVAFCHGAAGIGLSRLRVRELLPCDEQASGEIEAAVSACKSSLRTTIPIESVDYSLCHGICGNAEFLFEAGLCLGRPDLQHFARMAATSGIHAYAQPGVAWPCGVPRAGSSPSLMLGTAGIGHCLLRFAEATPRPIPTLLMLRPSEIRTSPRKGLPA